MQIKKPSTKKLITTHVAKARCNACRKIMTSKHGGHFVGCPCGISFIDQERWDARYVRIGGDATFIKQTCPKGCKTHEQTKSGKK